VCPSRSELQDLSEFTLKGPTGSNLSSDSVQWIARMVSAPPQLNTSSHTPISILDPDEPLTECAVEYAWQSLRRVWISLELQQEDWRSIIMALDFSDLYHLSFENSNFSSTEFKLLADCIPEISNPAHELLVSLHDTGFSECSTWLEEVTALKKKAPHVDVQPDLDREKRVRRCNTDKTVRFPSSFWHLGEFYIQ
jgi:hypothetical protein